MKLAVYVHIFHFSKLRIWYESIIINVLFRPMKMTKFNYILFIRFLTSHAISEPQHSKSLFLNPKDFFVYMYIVYILL